VVYILNRVTLLPFNGPGKYLNHIREVVGSGRSAWEGRGKGCGTGGWDVLEAEMDAAADGDGEKRRRGT
jgi:hypothetical protein